jgi:hypothetical protein
LPSFAGSYEPWLLLLEIDSADEGHLEATTERVSGHYEVGAAAHPLEPARTPTKARAMASPRRLN